jgi:hypothetical protein
MYCKLFITKLLQVITLRTVYLLAFVGFQGALFAPQP